jgi:UDP-glucose 4-epimerase
MVADRLPSTDVPVVNGATGEGHSVAEFVALVLDAWGGGRTVSFSGRSRPGDPVNLVADATRVHALGFAPAIRLEQGIQAYVEWFRRATGQ